MATFFMFGKYSYDAVKEIHPERTKRSVRIIEALGGKIIGMYAICGDYDLVLILELPGLNEAIKASVELHILTGIHFSTFPAISVDYFDLLIAKERSG
jgi:uncharacterized protein with GYD domain